MDEHMCNKALYEKLPKRKQLMSNEELIWQTTKVATAHDQYFLKKFTVSVEYLLLALNMESVKLSSNSGLICYIHFHSFMPSPRYSISSLSSVMA